jgi:hypothetical protein
MKARCGCNMLTIVHNLMTIPSIKFVCPKCGKTELSISTRPLYCHCEGRGATRTNWDLSGPVKKVRKRKFTTKTRMIKDK